MGLQVLTRPFNSNGLCLVRRSIVYLDDVTLGKLLTEADRGQADYCEPEGVSVSQSSLSVVFDGSGKLAGERKVGQSVNFGVTCFLKTSKL